MSAYVSHGLRECRHLQVVPVISSFDCDGNIFPLYVRIDGQSLKIYNARRVDSTLRIINFNCEVMDYDRVKRIKLSYHIGDLVWSVPR